MKVMLLMPPNWTPTMPHLALPTLTAYLRGHGVEVIQRDLNLEVFDEILTRNYLPREAVERFRTEYRSQAGALRNNGHDAHARPSRSRSNGPCAQVRNWPQGWKLPNV